MKNTRASGGSLWSQGEVLTRPESVRLGLRELNCPQKARVNLHANARVTPVRREELVCRVVVGETPRGLAAVQRF